jgi:nicotinamide riboside transporter PnuC
MILFIISWILTVLTIFYMQLIYRKNVSGFYLGIVVCAAYAVYYFIVKQYASTVLLTVLAIQNYYGLWYWKNKVPVKGV